ncbi:cytochrome c oxidase assembly protein [Alphaproteobacteria bacterium HT1-32]|nr:cytochrome c oxidase assembly protein [Alphaproteobacteria bacterium HT1-32]
MSIQKAKNRKMLISLATFVVAMVGVAYASVPLYKLFCQVTGFGGTTQVAEKAPGAVDGRMITVRFNADVNLGLPWKFRPEQTEIRVPVGEETLIAYEAENFAKRRTTGTAIFNVTPPKAGIYFSKIACFCFDEQSLAAGEKVSMPVSFFVDPAILEDRNTRDVTTITLSYTFFPSMSEESPEPEDEKSEKTTSSLDAGEKPVKTGG